MFTYKSRKCYGHCLAVLWTPSCYISISQILWTLSCYFMDTVLLCLRLRLDAMLHLNLANFKAFPFCGVTNYSRDKACPFSGVTSYSIDKRCPFCGLTNYGRVWRNTSQHGKVGQMCGDKAYPFCGVTGRVGRLLPESDNFSTKGKRTGVTG